MTPLAHRIVRDNLLPWYKRAFKVYIKDPTNIIDPATQVFSMAGLIQSARCYEITEIFSLAINETTKVVASTSETGIVSHEDIDDFRLDNNMWLEGKTKISRPDGGGPYHDGRYGFYITSFGNLVQDSTSTAALEKSEIKYGVLPLAIVTLVMEADSIFGLWGSFPLFNKPLPYNTYAVYSTMPESSRADKAAQVSLINLGLTIYHLLRMIKNATAANTITHQPHKGLAREINHSLGKPGLYKLQPWHQIKLYVDTGHTNNPPPPPEPEPPTAIADTTTELHYTRKEGTALHQCRPHTRTLKSGKQIPVKGHPRGDAKYGIAQSYYKVMPERPSV